MNVKEMDDEKKYKYYLDGTVYFIILTKEEKTMFEKKYGVILFEQMEE